MPLDPYVQLEPGEIVPDAIPQADFEREVAELNAIKESMIPYLSVYPGSVGTGEALPLELRYGAIVQKYSPDQTRDEHGRFSADPSDRISTLPVAGSRQERTALATLKANGGFTYQAITGRQVGIGSHGYAVSPYPERETELSRSVTPADVHDFLKRNADLLQKADHYVGGWHDAETGKTYIDVSIVVRNQSEAERISNEHKQAAYFDFSSGESIYTHSREDSDGATKSADRSGDRTVRADPERWQSYADTYLIRTKLARSQRWQAYASAYRVKVNPYHDEHGRFTHGEVALSSSSDRSWSGQQTHGDPGLTKQEAGKLGEAVVLAYLKQTFPDAAPYNDVKNNTPIDILADHQAIEVKTGLTTNGGTSQQWRITLGQPGKEETALLKTMAPDVKRVYNANKMLAAVGRKEAEVKAIGDRLKQDIQPRTFAVLIDPAKQVADIFSFAGFHPRIGWNAPETKTAYVGSYHIDKPEKSASYIPNLMKIYEVDQDINESELSPFEQDPTTFGLDPNLLAPQAPAIPSEVQREIDAELDGYLERYGQAIADHVMALADTVQKYSSDQPRDEHGRFGSGGTSSAETIAEPVHIPRPDAETVKGVREDTISILQQDGLNPSVGIKNVQTFLDSADLVIRTSPAIIPSILAHGFENQFATSASHGTLDPQYRADAEENMFGISSEDRSPDHHPIYGYFRAEHIGETPDVASLYGRAVVILRDSVKDRATATLGDSLQEGHDGYLIPSPARSFNAEGLGTTAVTVCGRNIRSPLSMQRLLGNNDTYIEAQIHGKVEARDIEKVIIMNYDSGSWDDKAAADALRQASIPMEKKISNRE